MDGWIEDENLPPGWMDGLKMKQLQSRNYYCRLLSTNIQNFCVFYSKKNIDLFKPVVSNDILLFKLYLLNSSAGGLGCFAHNNFYFAHILLLTINIIMVKTIANIYCLSLLCEKMGTLFGGTVSPNNTLFGGSVPPKNTLFGGTVPPNLHTIWWNT